MAKVRFFKHNLRYSRRKGTRILLAVNTFATGAPAVFNR